MVDFLLWRPGSEEEIRQAAAAGSLEETHYFDIERELGGPVRRRTKILRRILPRFPRMVESS